jgi:hypothetical protein
MRSGTILGLVGAVAAGACSDDRLGSPEGDYYQYVAGAIGIPANNNEARLLALDLNGDKAVDNQLGMIFGLLQSQGFGVGETATESLLRGNAIMLLELQTVAFDEARVSGVQTDLGADPDPSACADPTVLATCGRHLASRASFALVPGTGSSLGVAPIERGQMTASVGTLPLEIGLDPASPLRVDLHGARIRLTDISPAGATAVLAGGVPAEEVETVIIPEAARNLARIVAEDCGDPTAPLPCGCPARSRGALLQTYFDDDHDCTIGEAELARSAVVDALFAPDVTIEGREMLSFGLGIELVPAAFNR